MKKRQKTKRKVIKKVIKYDSGRPRLVLELLERTAVPVPTQEEYDQLMQIYEAGGLKWSTGHLPTELDIWSLIGKGICIDAGVDYYKNGTYNNGEFGWSNKEFYQSRGWRILSLKEFLDVEGITPKILKKLNKWFEKNKPNRESKG